MKQELVNVKTGEVVDYGPNDDLAGAQPPALVNLGRAELDIQISTAKAYPRSIKQFQQEAMSMALIDEDTAASCFYVLKRRGKDGDVKIEGPGIRLAEIVGNCWRNLRYGAKVLGESEDRKFIIAEGYAYDLEKNVASAIQVQRRIVDKHGKRYTDDMVAVTGNAAGSIALRNAIFKVIPMAYVQPVFEAAKKLAVGDAKSLGDRRKKLVEYFGKLGVSVDQVLAKIEKPSMEDVGLKELEELHGIATAIKEGTSTVDEEFLKGPTAGKEEPKTLAEKVKAAKEQREPGSEG